MDYVFIAMKFLLCVWRSGIGIELPNYQILKMKGQLFQANELYFSLSGKASAGCVWDMQYKNENKALLNLGFLIFGLISEFV